MNLDILDTFQIVVERGSISGASRQLGISQPAVSIQIAALEDEFGAKLLTRSSAGVSLTEAGRIVLKYATDQKQMLRKTKEELEDYQGEVRGELSIAASNILGMFVMPKILQSFRLKYPLVNVRLEITNSRKTIDKILSDEVHIAAVGEKVDIIKLQRQALEQDHLVLIAPRDFDSKEIHSLADLMRSDMPLLRREDGSSTKQIIDNYLKDKDHNINQMNVVGRFNSVIAQINAVCQAMGLALVSRLAIDKELDLNKIKIIDIPELPIKRDLYIYFREANLRNRIEESFFTMCKENFNKNLL